MTDLSIVAIIPLYNGSKWIEDAIRSVFAQTLQPDEFIVVDDGSTDDGAGAAIVERMAKDHLITLSPKPNGGQSSARNFAVRHSSSAFIALLDQDDIWYPNHLAELIKPFREERDRPLALSYSHLAHVDENGLMIRRRLLDSWKPQQSIEECLAADMGIQPSATLMSRKAFDCVGGFDEQLSCYEDDDLYLRFFRHGYDMAFIDKICSFWRIHSASCMHSDAMWRSIRIYMQKQLKEYPQYKHLIVNRFFNNALLLHARALRNGVRLEKALDFLVEISPMLPLPYRLILLGRVLMLRSEFTLATARRAHRLMQRFALP